MNIRPTTVLSMLMLLTACGNGTNDAGPGGVSADDARTLDAAAAKLDAEAAPELDTAPAK
jgi:hypothetical protein